MGDGMALSEGEKEMMLDQAPTASAQTLLIRKVDSRLFALTLLFVLISFRGSRQPDALILSK